MDDIASECERRVSAVRVSERMRIEVASKAKDLSVLPVDVTF